MATLSVGSLGEDSGYATLSGLSSYSASRYAYFTIWQGSSSKGTETATIPANSTSSVTVYFDGLSAGTRYKVTYSVYAGTTLIAQDTNGKYFTTDERISLNDSFSLYDYEITLNSFDSSTGYADITVTCYYENPNSVRAYGHAICGIDGYTYSSRSDRWVSAYGTFSVSKRYTSFYVGTLPKTLTIYSYAFCYQEEGATSGNMAVETRRPSYTVKLTRPSKFYWISSSSSLKSGQEISTYITASKWTALQTNVNAVRVYKSLSNYSFTTVSSGSRITATLYNQIANAINGIKSGTVSTVSKGDPITASVMMALQNGINGIT